MVAKLQVNIVSDLAVAPAQSPAAQHQQVASSTSGLELLPVVRPSSAPLPPLPYQPSQRVDSDSMTVGRPWPRCWSHQGPPLPSTIGDRNSWVYVPLLLDVAGVLTATAVEAWRSHPATGSWWNNAVTKLRASPIIPSQQIVGALMRLPGLPRATLDSAQRLVRSVGDQPTSLQDAVPILADSRGYLPPEV